MNGDKVIWEYKLRIEQNNVMMPAHAQILTAQMQGDDLMLWALVDPDTPKVNRVIEVMGTGWQTNYRDLHYISTVQERGYVWHVFEAI